MPIEARDLTFAYPGAPEALRGLNLDISPGQRVALVGRNGAGKTTLAKLCCGLLRPASGRVLLHGEDVRDLRPAQRAARIGYVFQDPSVQLFASTVREELEYGPRNLGLRGDALAAAVERALALTELEHFAACHPQELSLALRRMTALASVLAMGGPRLFLDEPTAGLDARRRDTLVKVLDVLRAEGVTTITISHDMDFCAERMDRLIVLRAGELVADGSPAEVFANEERLVDWGLLPPTLAQLSRRLGLAPSFSKRAFLRNLNAAVERRRTT